MNRGFLIIEILISLAIITFATISSLYAVRFFHLAQKKKETAINHYTILTTLKNRIYATHKCPQNDEGSLNGFEYKIKYKVIENRAITLKNTIDIFTNQTSPDPRKVALVQYTIILSKNKTTKQYTFLKSFVYNPHKDKQCITNPSP